MKKCLVLISLLFVSAISYSQSLDKEGAEYDYFCEVLLTNDNKAMIFFADTDDNKPLLICDSIGEPVSFLNEKSLLIYMSKRGWSYVERVIHDLSGPLISISRKAYLLRKRVVNDNDAYKYIATKPVDNKKKKKGEK